MLFNFDRLGEQAGYQTSSSRFACFETRICRQQKTLKMQIYRAFGAMAEWTGLEPATPDVTGRYSNQLNYHSAELFKLSN